MSAGEGAKRNWIDTLNATWNKQKKKQKQMKKTRLKIHSWFNKIFSFSSLFVTYWHIDKKPAMINVKELTFD